MSQAENLKEWVRSLDLQPWQINRRIQFIEALERTAPARMLSFSNALTESLGRLSRSEFVQDKQDALFWREGLKKSSTEDGQ